MKKSDSESLQLFALVAGGFIAWQLWQKARETLGTTLNPASDQNLVYRNIGSGSIGVDFFDWLNGTPEAVNGKYVPILQAPSDVFTPGKMVKGTDGVWRDATDPYAVVNRIRN